MTLQTTLLKFFSVIKSHAVTYRWAGAQEQGTQDRGLQTLTLPLHCSLRASTVLKTQAFWNKNIHPWAQEPKVLPLLVLLKCRCAFRCKPPLFLSVPRLCSSYKCDFCLNFFFFTHFSTVGFKGHMYLITDYLKCSAQYTHNVCASYWQL